MPHYAVTAIGADRPGIVAALTGALQEVGGNLEDVSSTILRGHFAMTLVVDAPGEVGEVRAALERSAAEVGVQVHVAEVEAGAPERPRATHALTAYGSDRPGIVATLAALLAERGVNITDLSCRRTAGTEPIYAMVAEVEIPEGVGAEELEEAVLAAARALGIDARLEPVEVETL